MKSDVTVAVVGAGRWGQNLIRVFNELGCLAAIVDTDITKARALAEQYKVDFFPNIDELLLTDVTAIAIATPVFSHYDLARKVLLAKKDVFVEKPLTRTVEEADELIILAQQQQLVLMVGHLLLYQPAISFIHDFLFENRIGEIFSVRQIRRSLGTIRKEENVLYSFGVHDLAVLDYLMPEKVTRIVATSQQVISEEIEDDMNIHLYYASGRQAYIHLNWLWPIKERQLMILGEKGALHFDEIKQEVIYHQNYGAKDTSLIQNGSERVFTNPASPLIYELQHFIDCITNRKTPRSCGRQGREIVELMAKIMQVERGSYEHQLLHT